MGYQDLWSIQSDEIFKDEIKNKMLDITLAMTDFYKTTDDLEIQKIIYENLTEIKANLLWEWLNISLLFNRINILFDIFSEYSPKGFLNTDKWMKETWYMISLITQLEKILQSSWVDIELLDNLSIDYARPYKSDVHKIIYSK